MSDLTAERLREVLHYDPETGVFTRLLRTSQNMRVGDVAGYTAPRGYIVIGVDGRQHRAHRLAFLYMTGRWPHPEVDHRDGVIDNNRWANLREATRLQNGKNLRRSKANTSGFKGVYWDRDLHQWRAAIRVDYRSHHLGLFGTCRPAAHFAYVLASARLHGDFGRTN